MVEDIIFDLKGGIILTRVFYTWTPFIKMWLTCTPESVKQNKKLQVMIVDCFTNDFLFNEHTSEHVNYWC